MNDAERVDRVIDRLLPQDPTIQPLADAMRYAVLGGGKRIRPRLVYATGRLARAPLDMLDRAAAAVEFIHAYSLIHDDLPAMDDDDLRRGRPTVHIRFDQATAILAGDALQALAFEVVSDPSVDAATAQRWAKLLATAAGSRGMVGGQVMDLAGETRTLYHDELETLHRRKTGALLHAAVMMGAGAGSLAEAELEALGKFGAEIGLAFQIHDDVLDATAATTVLGKPQGADQRRGKSTYVSVLGLDAARTEAEHVFGRACDHLSTFADRAEPLLEIARFVVQREN